MMFFSFGNNNYDGEVLTMGRFCREYDSHWGRQPFRITDRLYGGTHESFYTSEERDARWQHLEELLTKPKPAAIHFPLGFCYGEPPYSDTDSSQKLLKLNSDLQERNKYLSEELDMLRSCCTVTELIKRAEKIGELEKHCRALETSLAATALDRDGWKKNCEAWLAKAGQWETKYHELKNKLRVGVERILG